MVVRKVVLRAEKMAEMTVEPKMDLKMVRSMDWQMKVQRE